MFRTLVFLLLFLTYLPLCKAQELSLKLGVWSKLHYATYDKKGNVSGFYRETIQERVQEGDSMVYKVRTTMFDKDYVPIKTDSGSDFALYTQVVQNGEEIKKMVDLKKSIPQEFFDKGASITIEGVERGVPRNPVVGDLPSYSIKAYITFSDMKLPIEVSSTERMVVGMQSVTTPGGTFQCWKFTSRNVTLTGQRKEASIVESFFADEVGLVKMITYNLSGKIQSSVELQQAEIVKPK